MRIGPAEVYPLCDGVGPFFQPRAEAFADASADDWAAADELDPLAAGIGGQWLLHFHCFAIRLDGGPTLLVDAGIGPAGAPAATWAPVPGTLPAELTGAGIAPQDVQIVVLTHLHTDHVGWAGPYLPNARYVLQQAELDALDRFRPAVRDMVVHPLRDAGRLDLIDGRSTLAPGIDAVATPGHTPGHQCVLLTAGDETLAITGDLLVHAIQLVDPTQRYAHDGDPEAARQIRVRMLQELRASRATLAAAHLSEPFHRLG